MLLIADWTGHCASALLVFGASYGVWGELRYRNKAITRNFYSTVSTLLLYENSQIETVAASGHVPKELVFLDTITDASEIPVPGASWPRAL